MKAPFFWISLGFACGIIAEQWMSPGGPSFLRIIFWLILPLLWFLRSRPGFLPLAMILFAILGAARTHAWHQEPENAVHRMIDDGGAEKKSSVLLGTVASQPEMKIQGRKQTLSFILESRQISKQKVSGRVQVFLFQPPVIPEWGDEIRLFGKLEGAKPPKNPGEFDYQNYLARQKIFTIFRGYGKSVKLLKRKPFSLLGFAFKARFWMMQRIESLFRGDVRAVLKALITGSQKEIPDSLRDDFMKTGTSHLLAVSGLNITLVVGSFFCFFLFFGIPQKAAAFSGLGLLLMYTLISGCGAPVLRAACMAACAFAGIFLEREKSMFNALCFAFFLLVLISPDALYQIGFQLSFLSVAGLIFFANRWMNGWSWMESFQSTLAATVATLPLVLYYFHVFSWMSLFANLLAIPLFHLAQMLGFFSIVAGAVPWAGGGLTSAASAALKLGLGWIHACAKFPWGYHYLQAPSLGTIFIYYALLAGIVVLWKFSKGEGWVHFRRHRKWTLGFACAAWMILSGCLFFRSGEEPAKWAFFSSGRNEIIGLHSGKSFWLVNTGRGKPSNQSRWILEPYLRSKGIRNIQAVILTDGYAKHWGGLESLARNFRIETMYYPGTCRIPFQFRGHPLLRFKKGRTLHAGDRIALAPEVELWALEGSSKQMGMMIAMKGERLLILPHLKEGQATGLAKVLEGRSPDMIYLFSEGNYSKPDLRDLEQQFPEAKWILPGNSHLLEESLESENQINLSKTGAWIVASLKKDLR